MRFITFLKKQVDHSDEIGEFAKWAVARKNFLESAMLPALEIYLSDKLTPELWNGFYKAYLLYVNTPGNSAPKEYQGLKRIE